MATRFAFGSPRRPASDWLALRTAHCALRHSHSTEPWRGAPRSGPGGVPWQARRTAPALPGRSGGPARCAGTGGQHHCVVEYPLHGGRTRAATEGRIPSMRRRRGTAIAPDLRPHQPAGALFVYSPGIREPGRTTAAAQSSRTRRLRGIRCTAIGLHRFSVPLLPKPFLQSGYPLRATGHKMQEGTFPEQQRPLPKSSIHVAFSPTWCHHPSAAKS